MTQTAADQARRAAQQVDEDAIGELEAVTGEEPASARSPTRRPPTPPRPAAARQADTRQRILDVALDLFTEQGFDGTSLREIAERLSVTKAALYYHFESKDDILLALHMRLHEFGREALLQIGDEPVTLAQWGELLDEIVD